MISYPGKTRNDLEPGGEKLIPLLEERERLLERLKLVDSNAAEVDPGVVRRVRADYRSRLEYLNQEIMRQAKLLETTLASYRELIGLLERGVELGSRSLDELEVRCALGEYGADEFELIGKGKKEKMDFYRSKVQGYRANVDRIEGVLKQIVKG